MAKIFFASVCFKQTLTTNKVAVIHWEAHLIIVSFSIAVSELFQTDDLLERCVKLPVIQTPASSLHTPCISSINAITYSVLPLASHTCVRRKWEIFNTANEFSTKWRGAEFPSGLNPNKGSAHCAVVISHLSFWITLFKNMGSSLMSSFSTIKWIPCGKKTKLKKEHKGK